MAEALQQVPVTPELPDTRSGPTNEGIWMMDILRERLFSSAACCSARPPAQLRPLMQRVLELESDLREERRTRLKLERQLKNVVTPAACVWVMKSTCQRSPSQQRL